MNYDVKQVMVAGQVFVPENRWILVTEKLPKERTKVLVYWICRFGRERFDVLDFAKERFWRDGSTFKHIVAWQPLPPPPTTKQDDWQPEDCDCEEYGKSYPCMACFSKNEAEAKLADHPDFQ